MATKFRQLWPWDEYITSATEVGEKISLFEGSLEVKDNMGR